MIIKSYAPEFQLVLKWMSRNNDLSHVMFGFGCIIFNLSGLHFSRNFACNLLDMRTNAQQQPESQENFQFLKALSHPTQKMQHENMDWLNQKLNKQTL